MLKVSRLEDIPAVTRSCLPRFTRIAGNAVALFAHDPVSLFPQDQPGTTERTPTT
jgi:hypothetical protein